LDDRGEKVGKELVKVRVDARSVRGKDGTLEGVVVGEKVKGVVVVVGVVVEAGKGLVGLFSLLGLGLGRRRRRRRRKVAVVGRGEASVGRRARTAGRLVGLVVGL
jgi:hypothetical protein